MLNKGKDFEDIDTEVCSYQKEISETEAIIYDWVAEHFGETEAMDPSWNITLLAEHIDKCKAKGNYKQKYTVVYRDEGECNCHL